MGSPRVRTGLEVALVLGLSLGQSAVYAVLDLWNKMTKPEPLVAQRTSLTQSWAPDRPWLDLGYQLAAIVFPLMPALLALYLLSLHPGRVGETIGWLRSGARRDWAWALAICAGVGIPGIGLYVAARALGVNTTVEPANLTAQWWTIPVYLGLAAMNGVLEEVVMIGYVFTRLRERAWAWWAIIAFSALIRGSYHLYQGFGGFVGNLVMGVLFGLFFVRTRRVAPLVYAHFLMDAFVYLGFPLAVGLIPGLR